MITITRLLSNTSIYLYAFTRGLGDFFEQYTRFHHALHVYGPSSSPCSILVAEPYTIPHVLSCHCLYNSKQKKLYDRFSFCCNFVRILHSVLLTYFSIQNNNHKYAIIIIMSVFLVVILVHFCSNRLCVRNSEES